MTQRLAETASLPFEFPVSPRQALQHKGWKHARSAVLTALAEGRLAVLVGESGAGKTLMLRELERTLCDAGVMARRDGPDTAAALVAPQIVRLVDDADALDDAVLSTIAQRSRAAVLAVLPRSVDRIMALPRPVALTRLAPLSEADARDFVAAALAAAGRPVDLFSAEAIAALAFLSQGRPGKLNLLGQAALLHAQLEEASHVQPEHVTRAAESVPPATHAASIPAPQRGLPAASARAGPGSGPLDTGVREPAEKGWRKPALLIASALVLGLAMTGWLLMESPPRLSDEATPADIAGATAGNTPPWVARRRPPAGPPRLPDGAAPAVDTPAGPAGLPPERPPRFAGEVRPVPGAGLAPAAPPASAAGEADRAARRAAAAGQPDGLPVPPGAQAPRPARATSAPVIGTFRGSTFNETLGRAGGLQLVVTRVGEGEAVTVLFEASRGLIGAGQLGGRLAADGRLSASGTLMMGANPFATELEGVMAAGQLVGTVRYTRVVERGERARSSRGSFRLARD